MAKDVEEDAFAVGPIPVQEKQALLVREPGKRVADGERDEVNELGVGVEHLRQELSPAWAGGVALERDRGKEPDLVFRSARTQSALPQIDDAVSYAEKQLVLIPARAA